MTIRLRAIAPLALCLYLAGSCSAVLDTDSLKTSDASIDSAVVDSQPQRDSETPDAPGPAPGIKVEPTSGLTTTEGGGQASFDVWLEAAPSAPVTIPVSSSNEQEGTVDTTGLVFQPATYNARQTVTIVGVDDDVADGPQSYTIVLGPAVSDDEGYEGLEVDSVGVTNTDNETPGVTIAPTALSTSEATGAANTDSFTAVLNTEPTADVTLSFTVGDPSEGKLAGATTDTLSLTFTAGNWDIPQTVTVEGVDDDIVDGAIAYTITIEASSTDTDYDSASNAALILPNITVTNADAGDVPAIIVDTEGALTTDEDGSEATFTVKLATQPTANVVLTATVSGANSDEGQIVAPAPGTLAFNATNWNDGIDVTVRGQDDDIVDGDVPYQVAIAVDAENTADATYKEVAAPDNVSITNEDNDTASITYAITKAEVVEGDTTTPATITAVLDKEPVGNVVLTVTGSGVARASATPSQLTFTPGASGTWDTPQTVTVTADDDAIDQGDSENYTVTFAVDDAASDVGYREVDDAEQIIQITDNDTAALALGDTAALTTGEDGTADTFTVKLATQPTANVQVSLTVGPINSDATKTDPATIQSGSLGPAATITLTFTPGTSGTWNTEQTVTLTGQEVALTGNDTYNVSFGVSSTDPIYNALTPDPLEVIHEAN
jgi:hypothetical protein